LHEVFERPGAVLPASRVALHQLLGLLPRLDQLLPAQLGQCPQGLLAALRVVGGGEADAQGHAHVLVEFGRQEEGLGLEQRLVRVGQVVLQVVRQGQAGHVHARHERAGGGQLDRPGERLVRLALEVQERGECVGVAEDEGLVVGEVDGHARPLVGGVNLPVRLLFLP
jgi:hypothetical protein